MRFRSHFPRRYVRASKSDAVGAFLVVGQLTTRQRRAVKTYLHIGGLVAAGFDSSGAYQLAVTRSGRGVFSTTTWQRVARDYTLADPEAGSGIGIGPIEGQTIPVTGMDDVKGAMHLTSPDGKIALDCESGGIAVDVTDAWPVVAAPGRQSFAAPKDQT